MFGNVWHILTLLWISKGWNQQRLFFPGISGVLINEFPVQVRRDPVTVSCTAHVQSAKTLKKPHTMPHVQSNVVPTSSLPSVC